MSLNLEKDQVLNFNKEDDTLKCKEISVRIKWFTKKDIDIDLSCFRLFKDQKDSVLLSDRDVIFYNQLVSKDLSVIHTGDDLVGHNSLSKDDSDNEAIKVYLTKVDDSINELSFFVTIHNAKKLNLSFKDVNSMTACIYDETNGTELATVNVFSGDEFDTCTCIQLGSINFDKDRNSNFILAGYGMSAEFKDVYNKYATK